MTDLKNSEQCTLSIRLGAEGLSFALFNPLAEGESTMTINERAADETLPLAANLRLAFDEWKWLRQPFRRVHVLMATRRYTLLPLDCFEEEQAEAVFYHNLLRAEHERVCYNVLHTNNAVVLFGMDQSVSDCVEGLYPNARYHAQVSPLIENFAIRSRLGNTRKMYVHLHQEYADVFCYEGGRLLLANSYQCGRTSDRVYCLLYAWQTLGFEQERDELFLCGAPTGRDELRMELAAFVRHVHVMSPDCDIDLQEISNNRTA